MADVVSRLPVFLSEKEMTEKVNAGELLESEMETVAEIPLSHSVIGNPGENPTLIIRCKVRNDAVVCIYRVIYEPQEFEQ